MAIDEASPRSLLSSIPEMRWEIVGTANRDESPLFIVSGLSSLVRWCRPSA